MNITVEWTFWTLILGLVVLMGIIYVFWGNYKRYKSHFTRGLLLFTFLILLNRISWIILILPLTPYMLHPGLFEFINSNDANISFVGGLIQLLGLIVFLRVIMK